MKYLLDTNICIYLFRGKYEIDEKIIEREVENCAISEISLAELTYGAENSANPKKHLQIISDFISQIPILPIYDAIPIYGKLKSDLRKKGTLISDFDLLIGATALANKMIMVTENESEFSRLENLKIENWVKDVQ
ncbi:MAG: type II toxin-antitoxin system VapC family toxin [Ekhidna sp.]|uniref:type II toxin-antitoxin system tRNA(fMet)-specific endonuclease VapC n=1 Tax=Ekhidna sp. TaxID=2608089 RepID=UPI0032ED0CF4